MAAINETLSNSLSSDSWNYLEFFHGYAASFSVIIVSELGDKTFFIAAIMAMRHSRLKVFVSAMLAIFIMNFLAVMMGVAATFIQASLIKLVSNVLFLIFSLKMFYDGYHMTDEESKEEMEEVQNTIDKKTMLSAEYSQLAEDPETGIISVPQISMSTKIRRKLMNYVSLVFIETFTMTFLAEWGDRSQISTIILAANNNVYAVFIGALSGHIVCTGVAVIGSRIISLMISVKTVTIIGAFIFFIFGVVGFLT